MRSTHHNLLRLRLTLLYRYHIAGSGERSRHCVPKWNNIEIMYHHTVKAYRLVMTS